MQPLNFWSGSEATYLAHLAEQEKMALLPAQPMPPTETPHLFSAQGGVGVISIHGTLVNNKAWYNQLLGNSSYPEIREALIHAATDKDVKAIALDIQSGGGMVSGAMDTAELIAQIDTNVKPVYAFSDSHMQSAAYWLGSSARSIEVGPTAEVGSVGVLLVHKEVSKALENEGIKATVIRSGKYKALGASVEPLTQEGRETLQAQVDQVNKIFVDYVAKARKTSADAFEASAGQGRVFIGQAAVDAGLVDGITSFDKFISNVQEGIAKSNNPVHISKNNFKGTEMRQALTEQQLALMAAGVVAVEAKAEAALSQEPPDPVPEPVVQTPEPVAQTPTTDAVVTLLQSQLATAQAQVVSLSVDLQTAKAAAQQGSKQADAMRPIVRAAVGNLRIALGGTATGVEALSDDTLLAAHADLAAQFNSKFKAGGVAAVSSIADKGGQTDAVDPVRMARLAATRSGK